MFTDNDAWAELIRSYKVHGKGEDKYDNVRIGMNSRLDTLQAAVLMEKLAFFDEEVALCNQAADAYTSRLQDLVKTPVVREGMRSSWAQYAICLADAKQRKSVMDVLAAAGIPSAIYYKKPMHMQKAFEKYPSELNCRTAENICGQCLSLPMHPYLTEEDIDRVCEQVQRGLGAGV